MSMRLYATQRPFFVNAFAAVGCHEIDRLSPALCRVRIPL